MKIEEREGKLFLSVRVHPKASRDALRVEADGTLRVALTAPPVEGAANKALCAYMARRLGLPRRLISVASGAKSRDKVLAIEDAALAEVQARLEERESP